MRGYAPDSQERTVRFDRDLYEQSPSAGWRTVRVVMHVSPEAWRCSLE